MSKFLDQTGLARVRDWIKTNFATKTAFGGASANQNGSSGLVPAPSAGDQGKVLGADGSWVTVSGGAPEFDGIGTTGLVPAPTQSHTILFSDGDWYQLRTATYRASDGTLQQSIAKIDASGTSTIVTVPYRVMRKVLWENASPGSNFAAQDITIQESIYEKYHFLMVEYTLSKTSELRMSVILPTNDMQIALRATNAANNRIGARSLATSSGSWSTAFTFASATYSGDTNNAYIIPVRITGFNL